MQTTQQLTQQSRCVTTHCISLLLSCISTAIEHHAHTHTYKQFTTYLPTLGFPPLQLAFLVREPHDPSETASFDRLRFVCFSVARPADSSWFMEPLVLIAAPGASPAIPKRKKVNKGPELCDEAHQQSNPPTDRPTDRPNERTPTTRKIESSTLAGSQTTPARTDKREARLLSQATLVASIPLALLY
ncbi:hypothetical protein LY76DRAFT_396476 [Colletotrichum caudatum]|nr:hypothetical protein LY76DRAFT_396476 [Colletotrichum caudatum]